MKACVLHKVGDLRYEEAAVPEIARGEVLLRVRAAGICGSDIPRVFSKGTYRFPTILGHEFAGEVVKTNAGDEHMLGCRFAVFPLLPCFRCDACATGEYQQCADYSYYGSRRDGAFAEYLAVKKWNLIPLPDEVSFEQAAMAEPCAVALHALKRFGVAHGDSIAIFGAGTIGLLAGQAAKVRGAGKVMFFDIDDGRLDFAKRIGFEHAVNSTAQSPEEYVMSVTGGRGADICLDAAGVSASVEAAATCAGRSGKLVLMGNPAGDMHFSQKGYWEILRRQLTLKGTWNSSYSGPCCDPGRDAGMSIGVGSDAGAGVSAGASPSTGMVSDADNDWTEAIGLIRDGLFDLNPLITHRFALSECAEAFRVASDPNIFSVKVMFVD